MAKIRLDVLLVDKGYFESREKAKRAIMSGIIYIENMKFDKAGTLVKEDSIIDIRGRKLPYVSRGGLKIEKAINDFGLSINDKVCMDIGASTGGFTDCMLQNGARKVFSVDVGYGQLDWKLRNDSRVVNMERTNIRYVTNDTLGEKLDFVSIDVSFISLKLVLPVARKLLKESGDIIFLIKPQFEAGREKVKKNGVVRDIKVHKDVLLKVLTISNELGFNLKNLTYSPIKGPKGNIEFLAFCSLKDDCIAYDLKLLIDSVTSEAHELLKNKTN
ncbi:TlyA family RNA methyltransferase [Helicovermis profundi]|uniref:TlyA family rRNA (Cytidine-2'-O)-methyltransferase n=1 Tax=Helicovermis profundi TaxID=3065157 RepID=A0AAU9ENV3_9FIRM|nr:TlyA family rRNA (cytidine-2'-O)-methyltransferase [Clostridia bacterium S502]